MNNIEILKRLEEMQQTFKKDGLQGYEMAIVTAKNLINSLIQENKELKEKTNKAINMLEKHIQYCEQEAKGSLNNEVCNIALRFDKHLLQVLKGE